MSLFLTPDGRPFFGGTYFPPRERQGAPGFLTVVTAVAKAWTANRPRSIRRPTRRRSVRESAQGEQPAQVAALTGRGSRGVRQLAEQFDPEYGGFGYNPANPRRPSSPSRSTCCFFCPKTAAASEPVKPLIR